LNHSSVVAERLCLTRAGGGVRSRARPRRANLSTLEGRIAMASWFGVYSLLLATGLYRCAGVDGTPVFTDRPWPAGDCVALQPAAALSIPGLDPADWARVERIDKANARRSRAEARERAQAARAARAAAADRVRRCEAARAGLERIRTIKRRGYAAAASADLDARQRRYARQFDRHCR
jgi:hypothetical protein